MFVDFLHIPNIVQFYLIYLYILFDIFIYSQHKWLIIWDSPFQNRKLQLHLVFENFRKFSSETSANVKLLFTCSFVRSCHSKYNYNLVQCCWYFCQALSLNYLKRIRKQSDIKCTARYLESNANLLYEGTQRLAFLVLFWWFI